MLLGLGGYIWIIWKGENDLNVIYLSLDIFYFNKQQAEKQMDFIRSTFFYTEIAVF